MTDLENKLNGAKGQLVYWSRRVDQLTKQIKERDNELGLAKRKRVDSLGDAGGREAGSSQAQGK